MTMRPMKNEDSVTKALWDSFVEATHKHPRGMFFRMGDEALKMKMLLHSLACVLTPIILEVERLREVVEKDRLT